LKTKQIKIIIQKKKVTPFANKCWRLENQSIVQVNGLQATFRGPKRGKNKMKEKYPIQKSCECPGLKSRMFHIQLHKRQLKGSFNLKRLKPPLTRSELITFPTAFRSKSPTPLFKLLYSHANPFKCPNLNLLAARDSC